MKRIGKRTIVFENNPCITGYGSVVGKKEHEGPLSNEFDAYTTDSFFGEKSFEKAESKLQKTALSYALNRAGVEPKDVDNIFAGDLLNQCIGSSFGLREFGIPFIGLYGACSTMALSSGLAAIFVDSGAAKRAAAVTSSHFCSAERQYRYPLNYGSQRTQTAQWTVTGSGALILEKAEKGICISSVTFGEIEDFKIKDANNMGAAMAPAALDTLMVHFQDTGRKPSYYDAIISGDLGYIGKEIVQEMAQSKGYNIKANYNDCGVLMFDQEKQDTHSGGSGCACIATLFSGYFFKQLKEGKLKRILLIATGALMNSTSMQQGETIPGIAHAISIEM